MKVERAPASKMISQISICGSVTINPAITWEPAVGLYLNVVYIAKAQGSIFDVADLERVKLLRGPQSTLYDRNVLAGAVNRITKKRSDGGSPMRPALSSLSSAEIGSSAGSVEII